ncbi:MAG: hypothetical protein IJ194_01400 [Bacilli bacterium]|nr:hypothetical protein [Bacilli bacterium]
MGYQLYKNRKLNISFRADYRQALFGMFHVAFLDNKDDIVLSLDDKDSIESALRFYKERILNRKTYTVTNGNTFDEKESQDNEVLKQVLGLPDALFERLDLSQEIITQLHFDSSLSDLKRESYILLYQKLNRKWYTDDFKLYCLKKGFFFLYDETKPFMERNEKSVPVFVEESMLSPELMERYKEARSERFSIDFLGSKADKQFIADMKKFDGYSFDRRLSYFVNDDYDMELASIPVGLPFKRRYAYVLRQYLSALINLLYDQYSFEVLNKVTAKLSFMSISKIHIERDLYTLSSFNADMFSLDKEKWYFSTMDKGKITELVADAMEKEPGGDILTIYSLLGLPYPGYKFVKHLETFTVEDIVNSLPFSFSITNSEIYLSAKRYDVFYSYLSGEQEHQYAFMLRFLLDNGVQYSCEKPLLIEDKENKVSLTFRKKKRCESLASLFDKKRMSFVEELYPTYLLDRGLLEDEKLEKKLREIDSKSKNQALYYFYHSFVDISLDRAIDLMLVTYDLQQYKDERFLDFFYYVLTYPVLVAEREYRIILIENKDTLSLMALDRPTKYNESFEPNLPYPYVSFGQLAYSFREGYFSQPYVCSCQKSAIESKIQYLGDLYERHHPKEDSVIAKRGYIIQNLGLPENLSSKLTTTKDISSQIPYKHHICHLCMNSSPSIHEKIDSNEAEPYNIYMSYIRAKASERGVYFDEPMSLDYDFGAFFGKLADGTYTSVLSFDIQKVDPILYPYIHVDKKMMLSLIAAFFPNEISYDDFYEQAISFAELADNGDLYRILFDCNESLYPVIYKHMMIFTRLVYIYKMVEIAYSVYVSRHIVPENANEFCLNFDYNPRLPYPYIILGTIFNAYTSDIYSDDLYFCQCDKKPMLDFATRFDSLYNQRNMAKEYETPIILGLIGFPYLAILKYKDYDLSVGSIEDLFEKIQFRDSICRRCTSINHSAYDEPFRKAFPFKEDLSADYDFALNGMVHDQFKILSDYALIDIKYHPRHNYDLDGYGDGLLPYFDYASSTIPEVLFTFFTPSKDQLREWLTEFGQINMEKVESVAYASSVILDTYSRENKCILNFLFDLNSEDTLLQSVQKHFPEIERVRAGYISSTAQSILGFITYLVQKLIHRYAIKESHIGR